MELNPTALRARFAELTDQRDAMLETSRPLREQRDQIARDAQAQIDPIDAQVRAVEGDLFDINQELALISRALGGKTGEPDA